MRIRALAQKVQSRRITVCFAILTFQIFASDALKVSGSRKLSLSAGEAQSAVIPPGKNHFCPAGRILISNDEVRPETPGLVSGFALYDTSVAPVSTSVFRGGPLVFSCDSSGKCKGGNLYYLTNDHDLLAMPNGDVLYLTGAGSRAPVSKKPAWFDDTYRNTFGPGARSVLITYRSTDCGSTFDYVSTFDPLLTNDGTCALPQFRRDADKAPIHSKPWDMGGSDGQLVNVNPATSRIYLTFGCVGYVPKNASGAFELSDQGLEKTLLATRPMKAGLGVFSATFQSIHGDSRPSRSGLMLG